MNETAYHYNRYNRAFLVGVILNVAFVVVEAFYGFVADSLALLADAGHNLSDAIGLLLAWGGAYLARRQHTARRTYGWRRSTIFAALIGVGVNTVTALMFITGRGKDLNIRGAFLHMAADAEVSAGVAIAGAGMLYTGWQWLDPAVSLVVAVVILIGTWGLLRDSVNLAMDAVPRSIDPDRVRRFLEGLPGVRAVHDLHIRAMSTTETALTLHLEQGDAAVDTHAVTARAGAQLRSRFGIGHSTLQRERGDIRSRRPAEGHARR